MILCFTPDVWLGMRVVNMNLYSLNVHQLDLGWGLFDAPSSKPPELTDVDTSAQEIWSFGKLLVEWR